MIQADRINLAYIIDHDSMTVELVRLNNERFGFCEVLEQYTDPVIAVKHIEEAISSGNSIPQMILLDINMPVLNAWDFLDKMNDLLEKSGVSVIILSSSVNPSDKEKSKLYSSVLTYIVKPLSLDKIATILGLIKKSGRLDRFL